MRGASLQLLDAGWGNCRFHVRDDGFVEGLALQTLRALPEVGAAGPVEDVIQLSQDVERLLGRGRLGTVNRDVARLAEIRIPANKSLELEIEDILFRPPGRPSRKPLVRYEAKSLPSGEESEYHVGVGVPNWKFWLSWRHPSSLPLAHFGIGASGGCDARG